MTIKLPVWVWDGDRFSEPDELPYIIDADRNAPTLEEIAKALNAPYYRDLTPTVNRILDALEELGLSVWNVLGDQADACRAEAAEAITAILKDGAR